MAFRKAKLDPHVFTISDLQKESSKRLPKMHSDYFEGGAGDMITLRDNEEAYNRYKLRPRILKDVGGADLRHEIFGQEVSCPFGMAPSAAHKIAHKDGELASSRAAAAMDIPICLSSWSTEPLEAVIAQRQPGQSNPYAMQLPFLCDVEVTRRIVERAGKAGFKALFVSVDLPVLGNRLNESRNNFAFPDHIGFPHLAAEAPSETDAASKSRVSGAHTDTGLVTSATLDYDPSIHWDRVIPWLRQHTAESGMQIWLKGVYTPEDVDLAVAHGLDGVIISNHGGRQLDGVPATLDALRECAPAARRGGIAIAVDGGIRRGSDIFKALALGADFCFIGRAVLWGLAYDGQRGVELAIKILMDELRQTMMLCGCKTVKDISKDHLSVFGQNGVLAKL